MIVHFEKLSHPNQIVDVIKPSSFYLENAFVDVITMPFGRGWATFFVLDEVNV